MAAPSPPGSRPQLSETFDPRRAIVFFGILVAGLLFIAYSVYSDVMATPTEVPAARLPPFALLAAALVIALGFEFVNGFHDTANAVATVIYTHSLRPSIAVVWSGVFN